MPIESLIISGTMPGKPNLQRAMASPATGRNNRLVNFDRIASPTATPKPRAQRVLRVSSHRANANNASS